MRTLNIRPDTGVYGTYKRISYEPRTALAEFVDNSTQSFYDHREELFNTKYYNGLEVEIVYIEDSSVGDEIIIRDNAFGMDYRDFQRAILLDKPPLNTKGRNEFGMGLKAAACWFGNLWSVETTCLGSNMKYKATIDIESLVKYKNELIDVEEEIVNPKEHYTIIKIQKLNKKIKGKRIENKIRELLSSIYRADFRTGQIKVFYNGNLLKFEEVEPYVDSTGFVWKKEVNFSIPYHDSELAVKGFIAIRIPGSTRNAGFTLMRRGRVIVGGPDKNYRPYEVFGPSNLYTYQRLYGELEMNDWPVTQAKDGFDWSNEDLESRFIEKLATDMPDLQLSPVATVEKIAIHLRPDRLALYNVDQNTVIYELEKNISKNNIGKLNTGSRYIPIVITETAQTLRDILTHTQIVTKDGKNYIPAIDLVELGTEYDYKKITGKKEGVVTSVNIYNTGNDTREIIDNIRKTAQQNNFDVHFEGSLFSGQKTLQEMAIIIIIAILMLYFILAAQFESLSMPLIILVEIPIDLAFTLICLWCCGISLNLMSMIGIIVMCGVIINDSILKIDTIIRLEKEGYPLLEAIHEGGVRRLKPILMTSLTSIIATLPLLWGQDIGSQLQRPLAVTMIAGLGFGTVVSLYFVPLCYYYLSKRLSKKTAA